MATTYQQKDMSGSLFKNDRREKDTHPNATGTALIDGVEYWVSAWTKEGAKGKWQSLAFKRKEQKAEPAKGGSSKVGGGDLEDDVPFISNCLGLDVISKGHRKDRE